MSNADNLNADEATRLTLAEQQELEKQQRIQEEAAKPVEKPGGLGQFIQKLQRSRLMRANTLLGANGGGVIAAGMSFQALFAVFAALWVGFSIFGFYLRGNPELLETIISMLDEFLPGVFGKDGAVDINDLLSGPGLSWGTIIGSASLFMLVITWFTSTRTAIRLLFNLEAIDSSKNPVLLKIRDFAMALGFGVLILITAVVSIGASAVLSLLGDTLGLSSDSWLFGWAGWLVRYGVMLGMFWVVLWAIHRVLAGISLPAKQMWLGTLPGAVGLVILMLLGTSLLGGASKNPLLASFAVIIGLLLWFNFICRVLLFTSAWISAGEDAQRGLPPALVQADAAMHERDNLLAGAGIAPSENTDKIAFSARDLEPGARLQK